MTIKTEKLRFAASSALVVVGLCALLTVGEANRRAQEITPRQYEQAIAWLTEYPSLRATFRQAWEDRVISRREFHALTEAKRRLSRERSHGSKSTAEQKRTLGALLADGGAQ